MNASNNAQQSMQVNPVECARNALNFLSRAAFTRAERQAFDQCEGMLAAIVEGQVILQQPPKADAVEVPTVGDVARKTRPRKPNGHAADGSPGAPVQTDALG
jgi:hypothetical protein